MTGKGINVRWDVTITVGGETITREAWSSPRARQSEVEAEFARAYGVGMTRVKAVKS